jgi:hypothetical protein
MRIAARDELLRKTGDHFALLIARSSAAQTAPG